MEILEGAMAGLVIVTLAYISFLLTLRDWLIALKKGEAVALLPERAGRQWPLWTQVLLIALGLALCVPFFYYLWIPLVALPGQVSTILKMAGFVLYVLGLAVVLWARRTLGRNWGISTSAQVKLLVGHELVQDGPYAYVRHPMYSGWWACMLGLVLIYPVWAVFLLFFFSLISFANRARREEDALAARFGQAWIAYRQRTKRLIPGVY
jgi:protein-S-isoprenylcysteine O-methyltransferase Ste14